MSNGSEQSKQRVDDMTEIKQCYGTHCIKPPRWSVETEIDIKNSDGSPVALYACDDHCSDLTKGCREVKTRYLLRPFNQQPCEVMQNCSRKIESDFDKKMSSLPMLLKLVVNGIVVLVGVIIAPAIITYYLIRVLVLRKKNSSGSSNE